MTDDGAALRRARVMSLPLERVGSRQGFVRGTGASWREIWQRRELISLLTQREVRAKYKGSSLGLAWSLFKPLAQLLIYYFAIGKVLGLARNIPGFAIFVFVGLTGWMLFTEIVSRSTASIVQNSGLIKKVYLPREVFPLSAVGGALFNFAIQLAVLVIAMVALRQVPWSWDLLYAGAAVVAIVVIATGLGLLLAAANVFMRDAEHLVEVVLVVMFWASPIVYSFAYVHDYLRGNWLETVYLSNPVTLAILGLQRGLWKEGDTSDAYWPPHMGLLMAIAVVGGFVLLWVAQRVFARVQGNFAQEL